jgi:hypothetical protein
MKYIGKLDKKKLKKITNDITTEIVVLTDKQNILKKDIPIIFLMI